MTKLASPALFAASLLLAAAPAFAWNGTKASSLSSLSNPRQTLASASVQDSQGNRIGQVKSIQTNSDGTVQDVRVQLASNDNVVKIPAYDLNYMKSSNMLKADLTASEIKNLPANKS